MLGLGLGLGHHHYGHQEEAAPGIPRVRVRGVIWTAGHEGGNGDRVA